MLDSTNQHSHLSLGCASDVASQIYMEPLFSPPGPETLSQSEHARLKWLCVTKAALERDLSLESPELHSGARVVSFSRSPLGLAQNGQETPHEELLAEALEEKSWLLESSGDVPS